MSKVSSEVVELVKDFVGGEIVDVVKDDDHYPFVPFRDLLYKKAAEVGFLNLLLPEEVRGGGENVQTLAETLYVISRTDASSSNRSRTSNRSRGSTRSRCAASESTS